MSFRTTFVMAITATLSMATTVPRANPARRCRRPTTASGKRSSRICARRRPGRGRPMATRSDRKNELRVLDTATGKTVTAAFGEWPLFSADSKWMACGIGVSEAEEEKLQKDPAPAGPWRASEPLCGRAAV